MTVVRLLVEKELYYIYRDFFRKIAKGGQNRDFC